MKIAIVHDWLVTNAGAEKVLRDIIDIYPCADIFSLVDFLDKKDRETIIYGKKVKTSFIQKLPFAKKHFRNYLPFFPKAIESLDLSSYNLIISSSWAVAKGVKKRKDQLHICYCHTPIRYAWDLHDEYTSSLGKSKKYLVKKTLRYIKKWDLKTVKRVDFFIANSNFVANRIKKTYRKDSTVIYPPVNTDSFKLEEEKDDYYITASRLVPYKKVKLIVKAFNEMPEKKLLVIGSGDEYKSIKKIAKKNITLLGYQEFDSMVKYMQKAKAFVYAAVEDFGIVPIEAMACGTPVIALNDGGTSETVENNINGLHFEKQDINSIINAVNAFEKTKFDNKNISKNVQKYSTNRFKNEFKYFVDSKINQL